MHAVHAVCAYIIMHAYRMRYAYAHIAYAYRTSRACISHARAQYTVDANHVILQATPTYLNFGGKNVGRLVLAHSWLALYGYG